MHLWDESLHHNGPIDVIWSGDAANPSQSGATFFSHSQKFMASLTMVSSSCRNLSEYIVLQLCFAILASSSHHY